MRLILASSSPRRADLLQQIGLRFTVRAANIDESVLPGEAPNAYVARMAIAKGREVSRLCAADDCVLAADTAVIVDGRILGKPSSRGDAALMLRRLSGRSHEVMTAVSVHYGEALRVAISRTEVFFASLSDAEINNYLNTGEADDKAGGYGIQGHAACFVQRIHGSYSGVVGLPLYETVDLLKQVGFSR